MLGHLVSNSVATPAPHAAAQARVPQQRSWFSRVIAQLLRRR
jgi:hypothetical protein